MVGALETVLDPIVAASDGLAATFDPTLASEDMLNLIGAWLGFELDEKLPVSQCRELIAHAAQLSRLQGTRAGLELALALYFPGLPLRVVDHGHVTVGPADPAAPDREGVTVYCEVPAEERDLALLDGVIREFAPAHIRYRLRVRRTAA